MSTPEEIEVARRNLLAEMKAAVRAEELGSSHGVVLAASTGRDLIEVLEALKPAPADRLQAAEDLCVMFAWSPTTSGPNESDRAKAAHELWRRWSAISGNDCSSEANPHLTDKLIADLAAKRDPSSGTSALLRP